jgi:hypothetical protein
VRTGRISAGALAAAALDAEPPFARKVRFRHGTRLVCTAPHAYPVDGQRRQPGTVCARAIKLCARAIKRTPRSRTDIPVSTVDLDQGTLERNTAAADPRGARRTARIICMLPLRVREPNEQTRSVAASGSGDSSSVKSLLMAWTETGFGGSPTPFPRPARRSGMAVRSQLDQAQPGRQGTARQGALPARRLHRRAVGRGLRTAVRGLEEPLLPRRRDRADAVAWLGRRLDVEAQRIRGGGRDDRGCRRRGQFRPRAPAAGRREGWRPQLPGHLERARLSADLDEGDERRHRARCVRRCRVRRTTRAAAGGHGRGGRDLGPRLRRGHDEGGAATSRAAAA